MGGLCSGFGCMALGIAWIFSFSGWERRRGKQPWVCYGVASSGALAASGFAFGPVRDQVHGVSSAAGQYLSGRPPAAAAVLVRKPAGRAGSCASTDTGTPELTEPDSGRIAGVSACLFPSCTTAPPMDRAMGPAACPRRQTGGSRRTAPAARAGGNACLPAVKARFQQAAGQTEYGIQQKKPHGPDHVLPEQGEQRPRHQKQPDPKKGRASISAREWRQERHREPEAEADRRSGGGRR